MQLCMSRKMATKLEIVESSENECVSDGFGVEVKLEDGLLLSPLVRQIDELDDDNVRYKRTSTLKITEHRLTFSSPQERQNGKIVPEDHDYGPKLLQNADSRLPDASSYYQGTLQCSWKDGFPHYKFTAEKRKVYITSNLIKVDSCSDKNVDYVYVFRSRAKKSTLGEMRVSTSSELCPHGTQMTETKFLLCANGANIGGYSHTLDHAQENNKGLSKMAKIFKCKSYKQRISAMQENGVRISSPNVELAAIVMKNNNNESQEDVAVGGWGLKFLRKDGDCESCKESTGINVIVPAGFHGGPRIGNDCGPSSLVERWKSGGSCDCGGWDLGCPLTVLHAQPNCQGVFGECFSFDLYVQGGEQSGPVLNMVDVNDGAYDLRYKSVLSPLQSLSIAVAAIHIRTPTLRPIFYAD